MYVVCQYCNGGSLKEYLNKKGQLSEFQALNFFRDILQGFRVLHDMKIVHRDMKPANLLLHNRRIKIGDLGFSKSIPTHQQILTSIVGTPLYMSPQILTNTTYTQQTDIWSLGIILYQMLCGQAPWRVNSIQEIKEKIKHKPQFPRNNAISKQIKNLILRMLEYDQKCRISWDELFNQFSLNNNNGNTNGNNNSKQYQMDEQQPVSSPLLQSLTKTNTHFISSLSIQSQNHILYMLQKNNIHSVQFYKNQNIASAREYFTRQKQIQKQSKIIQNVVDIWVQQRNKVGFLVRIFMEIYDCCCEDYDQPLTYATMFMILKFALVAIENLLKNQPPTQTISQQILQIYNKSYYGHNFKKLLTLDYQILTQLLNLYTKELFNVKMSQFKGRKGGSGWKNNDNHGWNNSNGSNVQIDEIQQNLKAFRDGHSGSYRFTQFCLNTNFRKLFNILKQTHTSELPQKHILLTRMIYQYQKSSKTHIFANHQQKSCMNRKLQIWACEQRWKSKFKQLKKYQIQSVNSFLNREVMVGGFNVIGGIDFGRYDYSMM